MPSLTPTERSEEATGAAFRDGLLSGALTLIPSSFAVWTAMSNKKFMQSTNWQSRTAMVIMPPLFTFALSSEQTLSFKMKQMANNTEHSRDVSEWAAKEHKPSKEMATMDDVDTERKLHALYRKSVEESGVRVVPELGIHHKMANFCQENPFKILAAAGVPTVLYIFKGRSASKHLQLQSQLMHTRVYGQFAVITMLLTLMGFKTYMDNSGKYITEAEAEQRVQEMNDMRRDLLNRIALDKKNKERRNEILRRGKNQSVKKKGKEGVAEIENA